MEDEYHFLIECPMYIDVRQELLRKCNYFIADFQDLPKDCKLKFIFGDERILSEAVQFVVTAYHMRKTLPM